MQGRNSKIRIPLLKCCLSFFFFNTLVLKMMIWQELPYRLSLLPLHCPASVTGKRTLGVFSFNKNVSGTKRLADFIYLLTDSIVCLAISSFLLAFSTFLLAGSTNSLAEHLVLLAIYAVCLAINV